MFDKLDELDKRVAELASRTALSAPEEEPLMTSNGFLALSGNMSEMALSTPA